MRTLSLITLLLFSLAATAVESETPESGAGSHSAPGLSQDVGPGVFPVNSAQEGFVGEGLQRTEFSGDEKALIDRAMETLK